MAIESLETDYLVIGSGGMGMAFTDELLTQDTKAHVVMIDRHAKPGGHWNDAYPFVTLHQPAAFYGVNSEDLGPGGTYLASGAEVLAYYERVLAKWLATGRLQYFPMCESVEDAHFRSNLDEGQEYRVKVRKKTVDSTYMNVQVPSIRPPQYEVAPGVCLVPPNELPKVRKPHDGYVVVGAGKTGMDAVLFLLAQGAAPDAVTWIMPNDAWLIDRATFDPRHFIGKGSQSREIVQAGTLDELMGALDAAEKLLRLDPDVWPTKYRCATVNQEELRQLRRVDNVVRMGRVVRIDPSSIVLEQGSIPTSPETLYVDCTADGLAKRAARPIFKGDRITLQSVMQCQQVFSASLIGYIESRYDNDERMNALVRPVPHPEHARDFLLTNSISNQNIANCMKAFPLWLLRSRLSMFNYLGILRMLQVGLYEAKYQAKANANTKALVAREFPGMDL